MVLIYDGSLEHVRFSDKYFEFDNSFDVTKFPQQIEIPVLMHMCAPCSEIPSNLSTMLDTEK